ncbi:SufD family Fe-S cluster assembly protein [Candidatus Gracilibacteria bacterium]|jgi:Fe-S cluster assembly scaffold protein SufB|nr:SufD family Fe-S cluster assembly protein [Candidatus Gracilibacteria bacterium]
MTNNFSLIITPEEAKKLFLKKTEPIIVNLDKPDMLAEILVMIKGEKEEKYDFEIKVIHSAPHTKSRIYVRSILENSSSVNFAGTARINETADFSETDLSHHTLLLSENSKTNTLPAMEIISNTSKGNHAATIGRIDKEILFYIESRGIDETQAKKLIAENFLKADISKLETLKK